MQISSGIKIPYLRWWIAGLLFLATVINYLSRQTLSVLAPTIRDQYHLTNAGYSVIVFAFLLAYTFSQAGFGKIMDWIGTRMGMTLAIVWWSVASILHATSCSAFQFAIWRFFLGIGEAGNWPGAVKAIAEWFPPKERAFATAIFNSGSCIGAPIAPPLVVWIAVTWNWQMAFIVTGALGFVWALFWLYLYHAPSKHPNIKNEELVYITQGGMQATSAVQPSAQNRRWIKLFADRNTLALMAARLFADPVWWFYVFWLPEYFKRERNFTLEMIGLLVWIPFLTADIGNLIGGGLSSYLIKRNVSVVKSRKIVMCASALLMLAGIPAVFVSNAWLALALISVATFAYSSWGTNILTVPADVFEHGSVASVTGLSGTGGAIGGMTFMLLVGIVVDRFSYGPVFIAAGIMPVIAASFIMLGLRDMANEEKVRIAR